MTASKDIRHHGQCVPGLIQQRRERGIFLCSCCCLVGNLITWRSSSFGVSHTSSQLLLQTRRIEPRCLLWLSRLCSPAALLFYFIFKSKSLPSKFLTNCTHSSSLSIKMLSDVYNIQELLLYFPTF